MTMYRVFVRETHTAHMRVEADSKEDAVVAILEGDGEQVALEYNSGSDPAGWIVEEED